MVKREFKQSESSMTFYVKAINLEILVHTINKEQNMLETAHLKNKNGTSINKLELTQNYISNNISQLGNNKETQARENEKILRGLAVYYMSTTVVGWLRNFFN